MKKLCLITVILLILTGCEKPETFETMSDEYVVPDAPQQQQTQMILDRECLSIGQTQSNDKIYLCDDFCVMVQTFSAGNLEATIRNITGFEKEKLTVLKRTANDVTSYECVWVSAGEGGDQVGRMLILDDGLHHYTLSVMADSEKAGELTDTWQLLFDSFYIGQPESTKG